MKELRMLKRAQLFMIAGCVFFSLFLGTLLCKNVSAASDATIMKKWIFTQYYQCVKDDINSPIKQKESGEVAKDVFSKSGSLALPSNNFQHSVMNGKVNCRELFLGTSGLKTGVLDYAGMNKETNWNNPGQARVFLEKLGYSIDETDGQKFTIQAIKTSCYSSGSTTNCLPNDDEKEISSVVVTATKRDDGTTWYSTSGPGLFNDISIKFENHNMKIEIDGSLLGGCEKIYDSQAVIIPLKNNVQEFYRDVENELKQVTWGLRCGSGGMMGASLKRENYYSFNATREENGTGGIISSSDAGDFVYAEGGNLYNVSNESILDMSGMDLAGLALTPSERYQLYYYYLDKNLPNVIQNRLTREPSSKDGLIPIRLKSPEGIFETYYANFNRQDLNSISVYTQTMTTNGGNQLYPTIKTITMQKIVDWFNSVDIDTLDDVLAVGDSGSGIGPGNISENVNTDPTCASSGAAESLGWIICPILNLLSNASETIYDEYVEPALQVQPILFSGQDDTYGTGFAWSIFQGIANIIFIILLIVVIFSQLTGVGIDNYGIKKILPKLIIAAILINLSYLICLVCVDLSNITGNGLQSLFGNLPVGNGAPQSIEVAGTPINTTVDGTASGVSIAAVGTTTLTGVALLGILATSIWGAVSSGGVLGGIILPLLVAAITVVISIFFLFLLLAARQAAIIALTVISPLAFACYILPNTKKLFDRWVKIGQGLLLVYPIAGLLIGGGNYVSRLLLSAGTGAGGFAMAFMAMIVGVVPIFFIPSILKGSFAAMGNLGAKISGFGDRLRGGAVRRVQGSEAYKMAQERGREQGTRIRAGIDRNGNDRNVSRFGKLIRGGQRGVARARSQYLKDQDARSRESSLMGVGYEAARVAQEKKAGADEISNYELLVKNATNDGAILTDVDINSADYKAGKRSISQIFKEYMDKGNYDGARAVARIASRRKDTAKDFVSMMTKGDFSGEGLKKVSKELAEGINSKMVRAGSPFEFEYVSRINDGSIDADMSFDNWLSNTKNINDALQHHVTTADELMGVQGKSLRTMADLIKNGKMDQYDINYLQNLAQESIRTNKENGTPLDITKAEQIYRLAYGDSDYQAKMIADGIGNLIKNIASNPASGAINNRANATSDVVSQISQAGVAREGETFNARAGETGDSGSIIRASDEEIRQAMRDFDESQRNNPNWPGNRR